MSVVIKGMEMPHSCSDCNFYNPDYCMQNNIGYRECALVELPENHGRLVDADALIAKYGEMSNLIERNAAINALEEHRALFCDNTPESFSRLALEDKARVDEIDSAIATLVNLPSAEQMGWTPTSVRPPKEFERVFVQFTYGDYGMSKYIPPRFGGKKRPDGYWGDTDEVDYEYFDIVAWRPLPEPYREGK